MRAPDELRALVETTLAALALHPSLAGLQERARKHETTHRYSLEQFGLEADEIRARLADLFKRFGWEDAR